MAYLAEYGLFFAKALTLFLLIVGILLSAVGVAMRNRHTPSEQIDVKRINDRFRDMADALEMSTLPPALVKKRQKAQKVMAFEEAWEDNRQAGLPPFLYRAPWLLGSFLLGLTYTSP